MARKYTIDDRMANLMILSTEKTHSKHFEEHSGTKVGCSHTCTNFLK